MRHSRTDVPASSDPWKASCTPGAYTPITTPSIMAIRTRKASIRSRMDNDLTRPEHASASQTLREPRVAELPRSSPVAVCDAAGASGSSPNNCLAPEATDSCAAPFGIWGPVE